MQTVTIKISDRDARQCAMLKAATDAAFKAIWNSAMENPNIDGLPDEDCQTFAEVALEAAGVPALLEQVAEQEASFNLRWQADQRAIQRWQAAHPEKPLTWPDHADLCVWLMERIAELKAEIARNQACIRLKLLPFEKEILEKYPEHQKTIDGWNDFLKRIAELETENAALRQKAQASAGGEDVRA